MVVIRHGQIGRFVLGVVDLVSHPGIGHVLNPFPHSMVKIVRTLEKLLNRSLVFLRIVKVLLTASFNNRKKIIRNQFLHISLLPRNALL